MTDVWVTHLGHLATRLDGKRGIVNAVFPEVWGGFSCVDWRLLWSAYVPNL